MSRFFLRQSPSQSQSYPHFFHANGQLVPERIKGNLKVALLDHFYLLQPQAGLTVFISRSAEDRRLSWFKCVNCIECVRIAVESNDTTLPPDDFEKDIFHPASSDGLCSNKRCLQFFRLGEN